jgi:hypothetical protein
VIEFTRRIIGIELYKSNKSCDGIEKLYLSRNEKAQAKVTADTSKIKIKNF